MSDRLKSVVLVDDDEVTNFINSVFLIKADCTDEIITFLDAESALRFLSDKVENESILPDLIFVDVNMPLMNGWQFVEKYAAIDHSQRKNTTLVILSMEFSAEDHRVASKYESTVILKEKPLSVELIRELINERRLELLE